MVIFLCLARSLNLRMNILTLVLFKICSSLSSVIFNLTILSFYGPSLIGYSSLGSLSINILSIPFASYIETLQYVNSKEDSNHYSPSPSIILANIVVFLFSYSILFLFLIHSTPNIESLIFFTQGFLVSVSSTLSRTTEAREDLSILKSLIRIRTIIYILLALLFCFDLLSIKAVIIPFFFEFIYVTFLSTIPRNSFSSCIQYLTLTSLTKSLKTYTGPLMINKCLSLAYRSSISIFIAFDSIELLGIFDTIRSIYSKYANFSSSLLSIFKTRLLRNILNENLKTSYALACSFSMRFILAVFSILICSYFSPTFLTPFVILSFSF